MGFVSVSVGEGLNEIFKGLGVDYVIEGGQTMNPSTEDVLKGIEKVHADTVFVFPNNKNIILAAEQARDLTEDKKVIVVPSVTIPQGITAIINYIEGMSDEENSEHMRQEMEHVRSGQVTYAVRDTVIDDIQISEGDIMGLGDSGILAVGKDIKETTVDLIGHMIDEDSELISVYYGSDVSEEEAEELAGEVEEKYPELEVELQPGGQPVYYYIVSVE